MSSKNAIAITFTAAALAACSAQVGETGATGEELRLYQSSNGYCMYEGLVDCLDEAGNSMSQTSKAYLRADDQGGCAETVTVNYTNDGWTCTGIIPFEDPNVAEPYEEPGEPTPELALSGSGDGMCYYEGDVTCGERGTRNTYTMPAGTAVVEPEGGCAANVTVNLTLENGDRCTGIIAWLPDDTSGDADPGDEGEL